MKQTAHPLPGVGETPFWIEPLKEMTVRLDLKQWNKGGCFAFANALSRVYRLPLYGVCSQDEDGGFPVEHAMVKYYDLFYDFRGAWEDPLQSIKSQRKLYIKPKRETFWFEDEFLDDADFKLLKRILLTGKIK